VPEFLWFGIAPSATSWIGIVITCLGVGLVVWRVRKPDAPLESTS
jgi:hypothetical protein